LAEIVDADQALRPCDAIDHLLKTVLAEPFAFAIGAAAWFIAADV
jgi:hypothetical protein